MPRTRRAAASAAADSAANSVAVASNESESSCIRRPQQTIQRRIPRRTAVPEQENNIPSSVFLYGTDTAVPVAPKSVDASISSKKKKSHHRRTTRSRTSTKKPATSTRLEASGRSTDRYKADECKGVKDREEALMKKIQETRNPKKKAVERDIPKPDESNTASVDSVRHRSGRRTGVSGRRILQAWSPEPLAATSSNEEESILASRTRMRTHRPLRQNIPQEHQKLKTGTSATFLESEGAPARAVQTRTRPQNEHEILQLARGRRSARLKDPSAYEIESPTISMKSSQLKPSTQLPSTRLNAPEINVPNMQVPSDLLNILPRVETDDENTNELSAGDDPDKPEPVVSDYIASLSELSVGSENLRQESFEYSSSSDGQMSKEALLGNKDEKKKEFDNTSTTKSGNDSSDSNSPFSRPPKEKEESVDDITDIRDALSDDSNGNDGATENTKGVSRSTMPSAFIPSCLDTERSAATHNSIPSANDSRAENPNSEVLAEDATISKRSPSNALPISSQEIAGKSQRSRVETHNTDVINGQKKNAQFPIKLNLRSSDLNQDGLNQRAGRVIDQTRHGTGSLNDVPTGMYMSPNTHVLKWGRPPGVAENQQLEKVGEPSGQTCLNETPSDPPVVKHLVMLPLDEPIKPHSISEVPKTPAVINDLRRAVGTAERVTREQRKTIISTMNTVERGTVKVRQLMHAIQRARTVQLVLRSSNAPAMGILHRVLRPYVAELEAICKRSSRGLAIIRAQILEMRTVLCLAESNERTAKRALNITLRAINGPPTEAVPDISPRRTKSKLGRPSKTNSSRAPRGRSKRYPNRPLRGQIRDEPAFAGRFSEYATFAAQLNDADLFTAQLESEPSEKNKKWQPRIDSLPDKSLRPAHHDSHEKNPLSDLFDKIGNNLDTFDDGSVVEGHREKSCFDASAPLSINAPLNAQVSTTGTQQPLELQAPISFQNNFNAEHLFNMQGFFNLQASFGELEPLGEQSFFSLDGFQRENTLLKADLTGKNSASRGISFEKNHASKDSPDDKSRLGASNITNIREALPSAGSKPGGELPPIPKSKIYNTTLEPDGSHNFLLETSVAQTPFSKNYDEQIFLFDEPEELLDIPQDTEHAANGLRMATPGIWEIERNLVPLASKSEVHEVEDLSAPVVLENQDFLENIFEKKDGNSEFAIRWGNDGLPHNENDVIQLPANQYADDINPDFDWSKFYVDRNDNTVP